MNEQLAFRAEEALLESTDCIILHYQVGKRSNTIVAGDFDQLRVGLLQINDSETIKELKDLDGEEFYE